jgi:hypothetical protein
MTRSDRFTVPAAGFTFVAPSQDACEGDACLVPGVPGVAGDTASPVGVTPQR